LTKHKVVLITDSTCDIPQNLIERYKITVVPMFVVWSGEAFRDRIDILPEAFYQRLVDDPAYPTTAHPRPEDFLQVYETKLREGADEIVAIMISSAMSGAFEAAQQAAQMIDAPVHVVDAKGPTMSLGWQVLAAARAREAGGDAQAMVQAADAARAKMAQVVFVDTLEYLYKGGRIGGAVKLVGTLLNIKLLIYIDHETGQVEGEARVRTRKRAVETLYRRFFRRLDTDKQLHIAVLHGNALEDAQKLAERIRRDFPNAEVLIDITGPVLGVHTGPGALALCGYTE
jgi:DegV family protein with EDD domain